MVALVDEASSVRDGLRCFAVMNQADPGERSADNAEAAVNRPGFPGSNSQVDWSHDEPKPPLHRSVQPLPYSRITDFAK